jgi:hypothetical protein
MPTISGVIKDSTGANARRVVRVYLRDSGAQVGAALSDPTTGAYSITTPHGGEHFVLAHDTNQAFDQHWSNVVLACHFDGTNGSTTFIDEAGHTVTAVGNAQISTAQSKFGGASVYLDGNGDYLQIPPTGSEFNFGTTTDFAIECWIDCQDQTVLYPTIIATQGGWSAGAFSLRFDNTGRANRFTVHLNGAGDPFLASSSTFSFGVWRHVALTRQGSTWRLFVNGVQEATGTYAGTLNLAMGGSIRVGWSTWDGAAGYFKGYIDDLRITNGIPRYTANFTPPAAAFLHGVSGGTENAIILDRVVPV